MAYQRVVDFEDEYMAACLMFLSAICFYATCEIGKVTRYEKDENE